LPPADRLPIYARPNLFTWLLLGTLLAGIGIEKAMQRAMVARARLRFDAAVMESRERMEQRLRCCEDLLRGLRGLAQAHGGLDKQRFKTYLHSMENETRYPGLLGVTFGIPVEPKDRERALNRLRTEQRRPGLQVHPAWGFEEDTLVLYAEPEASNQRALGFNSASSSAQRDSLLAARDSGFAQASPPLHLAQAALAGPGMVLRMAVYRTPVVPPTVPLRQEAFSGCVNAVFLIQNLAGSSFERAGEEGLRLSLTDLSEPDRCFLQGGARPHPRWWHRFGPEGFKTAQTLNFGGRQWRLDFEGDSSFFLPGETGLPWLAAAMSLLVGGLLTGLLRSWSRTGERAQKLAQRMTEKLGHNEARLRAIARVMPDAILVFDGEGRHREVLTQDTSRLMAPPDQLLGKRLDEVMPSELAETMLLTIREVLQDRREHSLDYSLETPKGMLRFNAQVTPMELDFEDEPCVLWAARDVTERVGQEAALLQAQKLESLGVLAGGIAHDFNNLLTAIRGHLSMGRLVLEEGGDPTHHLDRMDASIQRAADLARQLLAYSGRASFKIQVLDLNLLVDEMSGLLGISRSKLVSLDVQLEPALPPIQADRVQVQQVVMNLVTNASEAIGDRSGRVGIRTTLNRFDRGTLEHRMQGQELSPGLFVTLVVEDDGGGMPKEVLARIFDPFFTTKPTGRGLGLSTIRGILRAHHAGIEISSRLGEGTTIALHFPATEIPAAELLEETDPGFGLATLSGTLLLAEDEPAIRTLARQMAERLGLRVIEAEDGEMAWRLFLEKQREINMVVLDLTMPKKSGAEVYGLIRSEWPELPILLCSGYSREAIPEARGLNEPRSFLQKPFSFAQFEAALRKLMMKAH